MGLLDFNFDDPKTQGLLSAAAAMMQASGPSRMPISTGQIIGQGLQSGMQGYQQGDMLRRKKEEEDLARQFEQMKMQQYQQQIQQQQQQAKQMAERKAMMPQILQRYGNNLGAAVRDGVLTLEEAKGFTEAGNLGRQKVARVEDVAGANGQKQRQMFDDYGNRVGDAMSGYVAPQLVNTGDSQGFVTPMAGQTFKNGMSPADRAAAFRSDRAFNQSERQFNANREDKFSKRAPMSATLQKELIESDDVTQSSRNVVGALTAAREMNKKAYSGWGANARASIVSNFGGSESADATVQLNNMVTGQALESLKATFGGMPTEGERKILLEMQASADKTPQQRDEIMKRAIALAEKREQISQAKAQAIRSGSYLTEGFEVPKLKQSGSSWSIQKVD
jgi:hypothetical protein